VRRAFGLGVAAACTLACVSAARAQQPFIVDDTEVTSRGLVHIELSTQADGLKAAARPSLWQNTFETEVDIGLPARIEVGFVLPMIHLVSSAETGRHAATGPGDSTLAAKWRLTRDPRATVSWATTAVVEFPTGSSKRGLGSSLVDYGLSVASQVRLGPAWTLRATLGGVFAGNWQSGAVGISARGPVVTGGSSVIRTVGGGQVGGEVTVAWSPNISLAGSALGMQVGGNIPVTHGMSIDVGVGTGWWSGSSAWSAQLGVSADVRRR